MNKLRCVSREMRGLNKRKNVNKEVIMKGPILVVLAAGMGSRYGGLKQIERIGPEGEVLLDYSVYDALRAGYEKVVFIIRHDMEQDFYDVVLSRMGDSVPYSLAYQELDSLIPPDFFAAAQKKGRTKPWGTCHALLCAEQNIDAPFTIINADDFYGKEPYAVMSAFQKEDNSNTNESGAMVPYRLENTLVATGTVTRGVCIVKDGLLTAVDELKSIEKQNGIIFNTDENGKRRELTADTPVSMNFWGFPLSVFELLHTYFQDFLKTSGMELKSECYIPLAADYLVKNDLLKIRALDGESEWFGVTYREDRAMAVERIERLIAAGTYPAGLWS
jgi:hypothetical protein